MAFHFLFIFTLLEFAVAGRHGGLPVPEEFYWKSVFPDTPMPKVLKDILPPLSGMINPSIDWTEDNSNMDIDEGRRKKNCFGCYRASYGDGNSNEEIRSVNPNGSPSEVWTTNSIDAAKNSVFYYGHGESTKESKSGNPLKGNNNNSSETLYFFQKDLHAGKKMELTLLISPRDKITFLPHKAAESMPFSSDKLPEILKYYSLKPESRNANSVNTTIRLCERSSIDGEEKYCATSLESFIDLSVSKLGKNIRLLSHELGKERENPFFTIGKGIKSMGEKHIVCHKMRYPYAVYLCHSIKKTELYNVPLIDRDGEKAKALAVCHKDTSNWSPNHLAFEILEVKPGTVPICHVLLRDALVWVSN